LSEIEEGLAPRGPLVTPYELVFGEGGLEERVFPDILAEAEAQAEDPARRERFGFLSVVADALRAMVPDEATAEILEEYRLLFYHGFNFWRFGRRLYVLEPATARYLVEAAPRMSGWELKLPYPRSTCSFRRGSSGPASPSTRRRSRWTASSPSSRRGSIRWGRASATCRC
jgi:hypothetical protein